MPEPTSLIPSESEPAMLSRIGDPESVARAQAEVQAMCLMALRTPRNETEVYAAVREAFKRPEVAANAAYEFPRGGSTVTGKSIYLARECAQAWGHIRSGFRIVDEGEDHFHISCFAHDLQRGNYAEFPAHFRKCVYRKDRGWVSVAEDERELRELVNRHAAFGVRNAILAVLPSSLTDEAFRIGAAVAAQTADRRPRAEILRDAQAGMDEAGVSLSDFRARFGRSLEQATDQDLATLRRFLNAIRDGIAKREELFVAQAETGTETGKSAAAPAAPSAPAGPPKTTEELKARARKQAPKPEAKPEPKPAPAQAVVAEPFEASPEPVAPAADPAVEDPAERERAIAEIGSLISGRKPGDPRIVVMQAHQRHHGVTKLSLMPTNAEQDAEGNWWCLLGLLRDLRELAARGK